MHSDENLESRSHGVGEYDGEVDQGLKKEVDHQPPVNPLDVQGEVVGL